MNELIEKYHHADKRLLLLDYDGTLVPFAAKPELALPDKGLLQLLEMISNDRKNQIVIVSGRNRNFLEEYFGNLNVNIVSEHGAWIKQNSEWKLNNYIDCQWKDEVIKILQSFVEKLEGTFVENKEFSVAWHYRNADYEKGLHFSNEIADRLKLQSKQLNIRVLQGNKVIEVTASSISKSIVAVQFISNQDFDFILAIGDDITDEDMFQALPDQAYSIKVGVGPSHASMRIENQSDVIKLLISLTLKGARMVRSL